MTEDEWLVSNNPETILLHLCPTATDRKLRLFVCACCRAVWHRLKYAPLRRGVDTAELFADGIVGSEVLNAAAKVVGKIWYAVEDDESDTNWTVFAATDPTALARPSVAPRETVNTAISARGIGPDKRCDLLRDIFGNPFRPVEVDPAWLTSDVVALARGIYEQRAFDRMPVLADALQDAGCDNDDVLRHCRDTSATHVRGCWVVDLILGKG